MAKRKPMTPARKKRLLKRFGPCPPGYTCQDIERLLDILYGMYSYVYNLDELRQIVVSDPFDHTEPPRQMKLMELVDWLEAVLA